MEAHHTERPHPPPLGTGLRLCFAFSRRRDLTLFVSPFEVCVGGIAFGIGGARAVYIGIT